MRRALAAALGAAALALVATPGVAGAVPRGCGPAGVPGGEWRSYGGGYTNARTQFHEKSIAAGDAPLLTPAWTFSTKRAGGTGDITGTPAIADGCMYVGSSGGWVFSVNADTGKLVWKRKLPYGGVIDSSVTVAKRTVRRRGRSRTVGTVFVAVARTDKFEGPCRKGDSCIGPYLVAFDQATGKLVWATHAIDRQPGADAYASPVVFGGVVMEGTSGGSAELGDEADRYAFQGSMNFVDANTGRVLRKTWTIHPPNKPNDQFAGATIWSTPAVDTKAKVAFVGTSNPYKPKAEHKHANAVIKLDVNRRSKRFGQIIGSYKGLVDNYFPATTKLPCYDIPGNPPPYYPQGLGGCGQIDLDFGAAPNLFHDAKGRLLVGAGQKSGVYHVFDAKTMKPVWKQIVGPPGALGGIVGSTANDGRAVYGPITIPGYVWSLSAQNGGYRWLGPIADGAHWGPPVTLANGVVYSVDFSGFLDMFDARTGAPLARRPLTLGGSGPVSPSWAGVSVARNTVYAAVGVLGLADGFVVAYRPGSAEDVPNDGLETLGGLGGSGGGGGGGGQGGAPGPSIVSGPGASSTGYATPVATTTKGGSLSYVNLDVVQHNVVSKEKGPDGLPLFRTPLVGLGGSAPVKGLDRVVAGRTYHFFCSVHPGMKGQLIVR